MDLNFQMVEVYSKVSNLKIEITLQWGKLPNALALESFALLQSLPYERQCRGTMLWDIEVDKRVTQCKRRNY